MLDQESTAIQLLRLADDPGLIVGSTLSMGITSTAGVV